MGGDRILYIWRLQKNDDFCLIKVTGVYLANHYPVTESFSAFSTTPDAIASYEPLTEISPPIGGQERVQWEKRLGKKLEVAGAKALRALK